MKTRLKHTLLYLAKFIIGLSLVVWILMQVNHKLLLDFFYQLQLSTLLWVILLSLGTLYIQHKRWQYLVQSNSNQYRSEDLLPSFLAGFTFRLLIPGGPAEVGKIFMLPGRKKGKILAFGLEKFFQTYIKICLMTAIVPFFFPKYRTVAFATLAFLLVLLILLPRLPLLTRFQEKRVNNQVLFLRTTLYSMGIYFLMTVQYHLLLAERHPISFWQTAQTVAFLWGAGIVPFSISGLGVREVLAVYFLNYYHIPPAHAVATSLFLFFINIVLPALIGLIFIYRKKEYFKDLRTTIISTGEYLKIWRKEESKGEDR